MTMHAYQCEKCGDPVPMTPEQFRALPTGAYGRRVRCAEHEAAVRKGAERAPKLLSPRPYRMVCCEQCGAGNPRLHYRLEPRNLHEVRARLCLPCGKEGWTHVDYARTAVTGTRAPVRTAA